MSVEIISSSAGELAPTRLFAPTPAAARRVLEFFTAQINNDHTRKAYLNAAREGRSPTCNRSTSPPTLRSCKERPQLRPSSNASPPYACSSIGW